MLCLLAIITYLDRVCISVAGPGMQAALHITPERWGLVGTVFLIGYSLFEIPTGHWGDTLGARRVLTRIVLWWSVFTALTGLVSSYPLLLGVRFLFGAGEAGAFPTASVAISNWFSPQTRGRAFGLMIMCSQLGGALSPLLVIPIQEAFGWRASFYVFGSLGVFWAAVWFWRFRDHPPEAVAIRQREHAPWAPILKNRNLWFLMLLAFGYVYTMGFYQIWFHTYLEKGRGFSERALAWSALPYALGAGANLLGGFACDWLVPIAGVKWSRRAVGMAGLGMSAAGLVCTLFAGGQVAVIAALSLTYVRITFQQPAVFTACLDIGGVRGGAVTGFMNSAGQLGAALSSAIFGYMVKAFHSYEAPLIPMAILMAAGTLVWAFVDVTVKIKDGGERVEM